MNIFIIKVLKKRTSGKESPADLEKYFKTSTKNDIAWPTSTSNKEGINCSCKCYNIKSLNCQCDCNPNNDNIKNVILDQLKLIGYCLLGILSGMPIWESLKKLALAFLKKCCEGIFCIN